MHSVLLARWAHTVRMQSAHRAHNYVKTIQRMQSVWLARGTNGPRMQRACSAHAARMQRALNARPANGRGQMTVPIKSDGLSCLPSYRSREEARHTRVIQHANQERKCDVSESDEEDSCSCCWRSRSWRQRSGRQRQKQRATHPGPACC